MKNFTFYDSLRNQTGKTKRWLALLVFCGVLLLGQLGFAFLLPNLKVASEKTLISTEAEIQIEESVSNNTLVVAEANANDEDPVACSQVSSGDTPIFNGYTLGGDVNQLLVVDIPINPGSSAFLIETIKISTLANAEPTTFDIIIHVDNAGIPGAVLYAFEDVIITDTELTGTAFDYNVYESTLDVSGENLLLSYPSSGTKYWMQVLSDALYWEATGTSQTGSSGLFNNNNNGNVWEELGDGADLVYELIGECTPINCDFPTDLSITQTSTAVTLGWAGIGNSYTVEYGLTGFELGTGTSITGLTTTSTTIDTTILDNGVYQFYVAQDCGDGDVSGWAGPFSFGIGYYSGGDIPTLYATPVTSADTACTPPAVITIDVPVGYQISNINVQYDMTAWGGAWMSEQRSALYSPTINAGETTISTGVGNAGTFSYDRNTSFANGATGSVDFVLKA